MPKVPVFYSFHYAKDVMRTSLIRNIGALDGNPPTSTADWEKIKQSETGIKRWIDNNMKYKRCLVVLIGEDTHQRKWINYEIEKAWKDKKAIIGIHIHNIRCPRTGFSKKGKNPFDNFYFDNGTLLSSYIKVYDPDPRDAYNQIRLNISRWIHEAIQDKRA
ncbi:molecular chaperone Tir [Thiomicrospira sp. WB1]|nr:molecular chaperone Tir [Thiomicrospira sp. WB1]